MAALEPIETPRSFAEPTRAAAVGDATHLAAALEKDPALLAAKDDVGCDPLSWAARNVRSNAVTLLLAKDADVESKSFGGMRPLHHACQNYSEELVRELLAKKADPNGAGARGCCRLAVLHSLAPGLRLLWRARAV